MNMELHILKFLALWKQKGLTLNPSLTSYLLRGLGKEEDLTQVGVGWV